MLLIPCNIFANQKAPEVQLSEIDYKTTRYYAHSPDQFLIMLSAIHEYYPDINVQDITNTVINIYQDIKRKRQGIDLTVWDIIRDLKVTITDNKCSGCSFVRLVQVYKTMLDYGTISY
jgi:hypothetical protein